MKRFFIKAILLTAIFFQFSLAVAQNQQDMMNAFPPSPEAVALGKYGEIESNLYEGKANITVPIYEYSIKGFSLPISLDYTTSAIRVDQIATNVGLGWTLNAGGIITQTVNGLYDQFNDRDLIPDPPNTFNPTYNSSNTQPYDKAKDVVAGLIDMESDNFTYSYPGGSGKFIFSNDGNEIYPIPYSGIKINSTSEIVDENGTRFNFNDGASVYYEDDCVGGGGSGSRTGNLANRFPFTGYSKFLTKVTTTDGNIINLEYESYEYEYETIIDQEYHGVGPQYGCPSEASLNRICYRKNQANERRLSKISSPQSDVEVHFKYLDDREDLIDPQGQNKPKQLDKIVILVDSDTLKVFQLTHGYFYSPGYNSSHSASERELETRLKLESINEVGLPGWNFEYNESIEMPKRDSYAVDYNGYYNGEISNTSFIPYDFYFNPSGANRDINPEKFLTGILTKVTYPTGGYTELLYDIPSYTFNGQINETLNHSITRSSDGSTSQLIQSFTLEEDVDDVTLKAAMDVSNGTTSPSASNNHYVRVVGPNGFARNVFTDHDIVADLAAGSYTVTFSPVQAYPDPAGILWLNWTENIQQTISETRYRSAALVQQIKTKESSGSSEVVKEFEYVSGFYPSIPDYIDNFEIEVETIDGPINVCNYKLLTSSPVIPFGGISNSIGHGEVIEKLGVNGKYGQTRYLFSTGTATISDSVVQNRSATESVYSWTGGKLLQQESKEFVSGSTYKKKQVSINTYQMNHDPNGLYPYTEQYSGKNETYIYDIRLTQLSKERLNGLQFKPATFQVEILRNVSAWYHPKATKVRVYDDSGTDYVETLTEFKYDDPLHIQLTQKIETNSLTSEKRVTTYEYASEQDGSGGRPNYSGMASANMLTQQYSVLVEDDLNGVDLSKSWTEWTNNTAISPGPKWRPWKNWVWIESGTAAPTTPTTSNAINISEVIQYNSAGNPLQVKTGGDVSSNTKFYYGSTGSPLSQAGHNSVSGIYLTGIQKELNGIDGTACSTDDICTKAFYDTKGRLIKLEDENGGVTQFDYDENNRLIKTENPDGGITRNKYFYSTSVDGTYNDEAPNFVTTTSGTAGWESDFSTSSGWLSVDSYNDFNIEFEGETTVRMGGNASYKTMYRVIGEEDVFAKIDFNPGSTNSGVPHIYLDSDGNRFAVQYLYSSNKFRIQYRISPATGFSYGPTLPLNAPLNQWYTIEFEKSGGKLTAWVYPKGESRDPANRFYMSGFSSSWIPDFRLTTNYNYFYAANFEYTVNPQSSTSYSDALGREIQTQLKGGTTSIIASSNYNERGLPNMISRPFSKAHQNSYLENSFDGINISTSDFSLSSTSPVENYYDTKLDGDADKSYAYSYTTYENSPTARTLKATLPGEGHTFGSGKEIETRYDINRAAADTFYIDGKYWAPNKLLKTITQDPDSNETITYTDGWGRTIVSGINMNPTSDDRLIGSSDDIITRYSYDELGQLRKTIDPRGIATTYDYDKAGRLTSKKLPDQTYQNQYLYDDKGRIRFHKDPNNNSYGFYYTKYDDLDRVTEVGYHELPAGFTTTNANTVSWPSSGLYVDEYIWYSYDGSNPHPSNSPNNTEGRLTRTKYIDLNTPSNKGYTWYSYNDLGLVEWVIQRLPGQGSSLDKKIDYTYDNSGRLTEMGYNVTDASNDHYFWYYYDGLGRLAKLTSYHENTPASAVTEAEFTYLADGQVEQLILGDAAQTVDYLYTVQGWLDEINDGTVSSSSKGDRFGLFLGYNPSGTVKYQYWRQAGVSTSNLFRYRYKYDEANRLDEACFNLTCDNGAYNVDYNYDKNGNIRHLIRRNENGSYYESNYNGTGLPYVGDFEFIMETGSNRIDTLRRDNSTGTTFEYDYDANGNVIENEIQGITATNTAYDWRNLPKRMSANGDILYFAYDADGNRVMKELSGGETLWYVRGAGGEIIAVYQGSMLRFINIPGGLGLISK